MTVVHKLEGAPATDDGSLPIAAPSLGVANPTARWMAADLAQFGGTPTNIMTWPDLARKAPLAAPAAANRPIAQKSGADFVVRFPGNAQYAIALPGGWRTLWLVLRYGVTAGNAIPIAEASAGDFSLTRKADNSVEVQGVGSASVSAPADPSNLKFHTIMVVNAFGTPLSLSVNGKPFATGGGATAVANGLTLGKVGSTYGSFFVAEAVLWTQALTEANAAWLHNGAVARYPTQNFGT